MKAVMRPTRDFENTLKALDRIEKALLKAKHAATTLEEKLRFDVAINFFRNTRHKMLVFRFEVEDAGDVKS